MFSWGDKNAFANTGDLREDNDLKQETVARILNVSQATYSRYETGILDIPNLALMKLAELYNTSTDYLLGLTNEKKPYKN
ncbi:MAG: helix-turn-helix domain-containing protein [Oscillospiraceae bacterium]|nr:helix-turn-helix domain-containing protein [Oscillospiraceae bacterium]